MCIFLYAMRRIGLSCFRLVSLLAWTGSAGNPSQDNVVHAGCRPSTSCKEIGRTSDGYMFEVNGHEIITDFQNNIHFSLWCNPVETKAFVSADDPDLPAMGRAVIVEKVILSGCKVPSGTYFDALQALNITVSKALLLQLHAEAKLQKKHLRGLQISDLQITAVEPENPPQATFDFLNELPGLLTLKLTDVVPEPGALMQLPTALETLNFVHLKLPIAEKALRNGSNITPRWLERLHALRFLHLVESSSHATEHPKSVTPPQLAALPNLTSVSLYHIPLDTNGLSSWLKDSAVNNLTLVACGLSNLPDTIFENTNLTKINLTYNNLTSLPDFVFSPLQLSLRELDLSHNNLSGVTLQRTVQYLKQLETLKVNKNPLGSLCGSPLKSIRATKASTYLPKSLRRLELSSTHATRICSDWVENKALMHIDLSNNKIHNLVYTDLAMKRHSSETASPVWLDLKHNPLQYIDVSRNDFKQCVADASLTSDQPHTMMRARVKLDLTKISIACDCDTYWLYAALRQCNLLQLHDDVACASAGLHKSLLAYKPDEFLCIYNEECVPDTDCTCSKRPHDNATVVRCTGTLPRQSKWPPSAPGWPLALHVAPGTLAAMPEATLLELHAPNNNITGIGDKDISNTLRVLDVRNNSILHVSLAAAQVLSRVSAIGQNHLFSFAGNRLACECADAPAFGLLKQVVDDWNITQCIDQSFVIGKSKRDLCINLFLPILFGITVPLLILVVAILLLLRMLPRIKQFLFSQNMCLGWILSVNDNINDSDKTHDVFLSYSYEDLEQLNVLKRGLEELGYSTIEHCRDWQPGDAVMEQIARSVLCARRTLLLVSDNYAKSKWALEEFHAAHAHAMERRSARVLIVRCGLQKPEVLPKDLKLYLLNHTYLAWEDPKFWYKLCCNMPPLSQEPTSVILAAHEMPPPLYYKYDANKNLPPLQISLISKETVPGAC